MATMNVCLSDEMREWVETRARDGGYEDASEYVRELVRRDQGRATKIGEWQALITEGLESGISDKSMTEILTEARAAAMAETR